MPLTSSDYSNMASMAMEAGKSLNNKTRDGIMKANEDQEGNWSLQYLSLAAGLAMMVVSVLGFLGKVGRFQLDSALTDALVFCVGVCVILVETSLSQMEACSNTRAMVDTHAKFMRSLIGRGIVFVATGLIEIFFLRGLFDILVGCFVVYVGLTCFYLGHSARKRLKAASSEVSNLKKEAFQEAFAVHDTDGVGGLSQDQFEQFASKLGLAIGNKREMEAVFLKLDKNRTGRVSWEAIQKHWWGE